MSGIDHRPPGRRLTRLAPCAQALLLSLAALGASAQNTPTRPVSGGALDGKAISKPQAAYPPVAKAVRASGSVTVQVTVDEQGRVISASAVGGHPLLRQAAVEAARRAEFAPTRLSGKAVKVSGTLTYDFKSGSEAGGGGAQPRAARDDDDEARAGDDDDDGEEAAGGDEGAGAARREAPAATAGDAGGGAATACVYGPPPGNYTAQSKPSEGLFKRNIYDGFQSRANGTTTAPLRVVLNFLSLRMKQPEKNTVTVDPGRGAQRKNDAAAPNVTLHPFEVRYVLCEEYRNATERKLIESTWQCWVGRDGEWACGVESPLKTKTTVLN